jgi:hypothetical protein
MTQIPKTAGKSWHLPSSCEFLQSLRKNGKYESGDEDCADKWVRDKRRASKYRAQV